MPKTLVATFLGLVAILAPVAASVAAPSTSAADVAHGFFKTVFGLEYGGHADAQRVKRFETPVRFHIDDRSGHRRLKAAQHFVASLPQRIRHLEAFQVANAKDANFQVLIVRQSDFAAVVARELRADAVAMNARCIVGVTTRDGQIEESIAIIVGDDDYLFDRCLVEEVLQGLGPMNDSRELRHSVFNDASRHAHFTAFDAAILNVLYHPAMRPGMTDGEAQQALPRALRDLGYAQ
ncbi:MAG: DUF2927 domain-containing protein [Pseudomonadota bacterium]